MWVWKQRAGELWREGRLVARGYAGKGDGVNNPDMQSRRGIGPLPQGKYRMTDMRDSPNVGPKAIVLEPMQTNKMYGRGDFRIHGDNSALNHTASRGCIILPRTVRQAIWDSGDHMLLVVA